jgi:hypothetical protein
MVNHVATVKAQCLSMKAPLRFIHIDKTGGTAVRKWFKDTFPEPEWQDKYVYPGSLGTVLGIEQNIALKGYG